MGGASGYIISCPATASLISSKEAIEACSLKHGQECSTCSHISGNRGYDSNRVHSPSIFHLYCIEYQRLYGNNPITLCYDVEHKSLQSPSNGPGLIHRPESPLRQAADGTLCFSQNWMGPMWSRPNWSTGEVSAIRPSIFWKALSGRAVPSLKEATLRWIVVACSTESVAVICTIVSRSVDNCAQERNVMKWISEHFWRCCLCVYVLIETRAIQCVLKGKRGSHKLYYQRMWAEQSIAGSRSVKEISCTSACQGSLFKVLFIRHIHNYTEYNQ